MDIKAVVNVDVCTLNLRTTPRKVQVSFFMNLLVEERSQITGLFRKVAPIVRLE